MATRSSSILQFSSSSTEERHGSFKRGLRKSRSDSELSTRFDQRSKQKSRYFMADNGLDSSKSGKSLVRKCSFRLQPFGSLTGLMMKRMQSCQSTLVPTCVYSEFNDSQRFSCLKNYDTSPSKKSNSSSSDMRSLRSQGSMKSVVFGESIIHEIESNKSSSSFEKSREPVKLRPRERGFEFPCDFSEEVHKGICFSWAWWQCDRDPMIHDPREDDRSCLNLIGTNCTESYRRKCIGRFNFSPVDEVVLVIGGSSFVGCHVIRELLDHGLNVIATTSCLTRYRYVYNQKRVVHEGGISLMTIHPLAYTNLQVVEFDLSDPSPENYSDLKCLLRKCSCIVFCASQITPFTYNKNSLPHNIGNAIRLKPKNTSELSSHGDDSCDDQHVEFVYNKKKFDSEEALFEKEFEAKVSEITRCTLDVLTRLFECAVEGECILRFIFTSSVQTSCGKVGNNSRTSSVSLSPSRVNATEVSSYDEQARNFQTICSQKIGGSYGMSRQVSAIILDSSSSRKAGKCKQWESSINNEKNNYFFSDTESSSQDDESYLNKVNFTKRRRSTRISRKEVTEHDWADEELQDSYWKLRILAEKKVWELAKTSSKMVVCSICSGICLGYSLLRKHANNLDNILLESLLLNQFPAIPCFYTAPVDVRDVAAAHVMCIILPSETVCNGRFFVAAHSNISVSQISKILALEFNKFGFNVRNSNPGGESTVESDSTTSVNFGAEFYNSPRQQTIPNKGDAPSGNTSPAGRPFQDKLKTKVFSKGAIMPSRGFIEDSEKANEKTETNKSPIENVFNMVLDSVVTTAKVFFGFDNSLPGGPEPSNDRFVCDVGIDEVTSSTFTVSSCDSPYSASSRKKRQCLTKGYLSSPEFSLQRTCKWWYIQKSFFGIKQFFDCRKSRSVLGMSFRPIAKSIVDAVVSLMALRVLPCRFVPMSFLEVFILTQMGYRLFGKHRLDFKWTRSRDSDPEYHVFVAELNFNKKVPHKEVQPKTDGDMEHADPLYSVKNINLEERFCPGPVSNCSQETATSSVLFKVTDSSGNTNCDKKIDHQRAGSFWDSWEQEIHEESKDTSSVKKEDML